MSAKGEMEVKIDRREGRREMKGGEKERKGVREREREM